jgi:hypothetical protein
LNLGSIFIFLDKVKVTLEIEGKIPNGAPDDVVRIVTENGHKLFKT